ncbi:unnamed protein product, partial [Brenthis ino]
MFVADVRTGALQHKDLSPRRCHHCSHNSTACELPGSPVVCPAGQPFCATVAASPNFTSTLTCAVASELPCSLTFNSKLALEMICICEYHLCNAPYSAQLRNELLNFSAKIPINTTELTVAFLKSSAFVNVTFSELYGVITNSSKANEKSVYETTMNLLTFGGSDEAPRAEALKNEATVPPDDDEDEGEGSGTFEENKSQAAPAAPSSFLPAEENNVSCLSLNKLLLLITSSYFLVIL